ncbi:unnamed protein product [Rotaria socialis]|uniref:ABC transporter domain-containing protein n=1 Tax=Rotaria socialis TaxID=392032 RepID=A0A818MMZ0_9BILA|nr:unnamed protein product [Rotaria socialis]
MNKYSAGPTGCGKSTLLDILADRKDRQNCEGQVLINGYERPPPSIFRRMVGYVVQDDIISDTLTVRENIAFSANLRLHPSVTSTQRLARVEEVIKQLGLSECANTRMGSELKRGVSGGERKRTCIAMELVLSPKILFLDEPTTGLDASTACEVMECLRDLSRKGCTIVFSIHQPRHSIFELFDTVLLLSHGHNVYFGSSAEVRPYFIEKNFVCQQSENPADFALDVLITAARNNRTSELCQKYRDSNMHIRNAEYLSNILDNSHIAIKHQQKSARSIKSEFFYVSQRTLRTAIRNSALLTWQLVVAIILALLTGLLYYRLPQTIGSGVQNRLGGIFFVVVNQIFSTATALEPFIKERALFIHENVSGYYSMSTLFLVKLVCDLLPMRVIPSIIFSIICYIMMGLQNDIGKFFVFFVTIFMANVFGSATCFFVAASISVFAVALIILVLIFVIMMVFNGFLVELESVFKFLRWIKWFSAFRYAYNVLIINEFRNQNFCLPNQTDVCPLSGNEVLHERAIHFESNWNMWQYFLSLTAIALTLFLMSYIKLLRIKKVK